MLCNDPREKRLIEIEGPSQAISLFVYIKVNIPLQGHLFWAVEEVAFQKNVLVKMDGICSGTMMRPPKGVTVKFYCVRQCAKHERDLTSDKYNDVLLDI